MSDQKQPIIIRRKKGHGHGAHGGAWKVAYADFVTAMMAFFMVMWLLGSDEETKAAVSNYFNNPTSVLRLDLSSRENVPLGDRTGAGESILKGADGEVPEEMVRSPSRPILDGNTKAEDETDLSQQMASSGDQILVDVVEFSVAEKDLFQPGTHDQWKKGAEKIFLKIGKLAKYYKKGKVHIQGSYYEGSEGYEFQVSRVDAVSRYLVKHQLVEADRIKIGIDSSQNRAKKGLREPASMIEPRIKFVLK